MHIILDLTQLSPDQVKSKLLEYDYQLPPGFDGLQHESITFDIKKRQIIAVVKKPFPIKRS
nr:hypothetical protein [Vibrio sp. 10N.286.48.B7]PMH78497.1 hypothetical protein BCU58_08975 [Vibrio sp. 10N.286.48.B7]